MTNKHSVTRSGNELEVQCLRDTCCRGFLSSALRGAGFVYSTAQPNTQPLYRCYSETEKSHFTANAEDCNGMGKRDSLLGYDLKQ